MEAAEKFSPFFKNIPKNLCPEVFLCLKNDDERLRGEFMIHRRFFIHICRFLLPPFSKQRVCMGFLCEKYVNCCRLPKLLLRGATVVCKQTAETLKFWWNSGERRQSSRNHLKLETVVCRVEFIFRPCHTKLHIRFLSLHQ